MKIWIAGFGNEHREDDAAGPHLASRMAEWLSASGEDVSLSLEHQLLPELAEEMSGANLAVFVDADMETHEPGWRLREIRADRTLQSLNIHSMGPEWLLALSEALANPPALALLVSVSGESFNFSETMTPTCLERIDNAFEAFKTWFEEGHSA